MIMFGVTRIVFKVGNFVIKVPNFKNSHLNFLNGCYSNYSERNYCKLFKNVDNNLFYDKVAPSIFCSKFGLFQIQKYCEPLNRDITDEELEFLKDVRGGETKNNNFGLYKGHIVCLDYP